MIAVLPAGGRVAPDFAQAAGTDIKALAKIGGQTLLARAIAALREVPTVSHIAVVGPPDALREAEQCGAEGLLPEADTGPANFLLGLEWAQKYGAGRVLIAATDLPFLTPEAIRTFLSACPPQADIAGALLTKAEFLARWPGERRPFVRLRDGEFTFGSVFLAKPEALLRNRSHLEAIFNARKSQMRMAALVGVPTILRFLTRQLTVPEIEARVGQIIRCQVTAVPHSPAELAFDIDTLAEFAYAETLLDTGRPRAARETTLI